jgi:hypothetical protein
MRWSSSRNCAVVIRRFVPGAHTHTHTAHPRWIPTAPPCAPWGVVTPNTHTHRTSALDTYSTTLCTQESCDTQHTHTAHPRWILTAPPCAPRGVVTPTHTAHPRWILTTPPCAPRGVVTPNTHTAHPRWILTAPPCAPRGVVTPNTHN